MPTHARTLLGHLSRLTAPALSDRALLARWTEGSDQAAFAELVARHGPMVLGVCRRTLADAQCAEDAFQATFLVLARKAAGLRQPESLASFLYAVALRLARKSRTAQHRRKAQQSPSNCPEPADLHPDPLDALSGRELLALLDEEVARLPEAFRLPVLLCVLQDRSVEEAARLLGWSVGSVRGRLIRGRKRLRERLVRRGICQFLGAVTLLAPALVPERLRAAALQNLNTPASAAVLALAAGSLPLRKAVCLGFLLAVLGMAAGLPWLSLPEPATPPAPFSAAPEQAKEEKPRDRYGDPLPPGAVTRLGTLRFRAPGEIETLALSPDGKTIVACSNAGLFLLDASSGKMTKRLAKVEARGGGENHVAISADGRRLAARMLVAIGDKIKSVIRVWDLAGENTPRDYEAENVVHVGWSAAGEPLAICLEGEALCLHELKSGRTRRFPSKDLIKPELYAYAVSALSVEGHTLATAEENRQVVHVWDTATGKERLTLQPNGEQIRFLAVSPDGSRLVTCAQKTVQLWDTATGKALFTVDHKDKYRSPVFSADGKVLAISDAWSTICFWDAATGRELGRTRQKYFFAPSFAFSTDGRTLATAERYSGAIHLFDVATGERKPEPAGHSNRPHGTAFTPDGQRVATGGTLDGTIRIWDTTTGESLVNIARQPHCVRDIALSPDGRWLYSTWTDDNLWICDAKTGARQHIIKLEDADRPNTKQSALSMHLSGDGKLLVAFSSYEAKNNQAGNRQDEMLITGWDTATRKQLFHRSLPGTEVWNILTDDARVLARVPRIGDKLEEEAASGPMRLEDVATGEHLLIFPTQDGYMSPLMFSKDGRLLVTNNSKGGRSSLQVWETATAAALLKHDTPHNYHPAFSADGRLLALTAPSQEIVIWDLPRGRELRRFKGFGAAVTWLAFSPDDRKLISGLDDATFLVWDVGLREKAAPAKLGADGVAKAWADLAGADAQGAFRARWTLVSSPDEAIAFLKGKLRRAQPADAQQLRGLLGELGNDKYAIRAKAQADLEDLGDLAEPALRKALEEQPTLEVRRRVEQVLERLRGPVTRPDRLRPLRILAVLEDIATPAARALLEEIASGAVEARQTREAKAAVERLQHRAPQGPATGA
jgi:RNA polymerase sigma factor (sigma-70 family)